MHHNQLGASVDVDSRPHDLLSKLQEGATVMIVVNDLDTILPHNFVEVRLRDHFTCLQKGVLFYFGMMQDGG